MSPIALIDPVWLLGPVTEPSASVLHALQRAAGPARIDRTNWYLETDGSPQHRPALPGLTLRLTVRDDLDDGYELVRRELSQGERVTLRWRFRAGMAGSA